MTESGLTPERIHKRLSRLMIKAFPQLDPTAVTAASIDTVPEWDSLATLTLFMLADDEFGVKIGYDRIAETTSYDALFKLIESRLA